MKRQLENRKSFTGFTETRRGRTTLICVSSVLLCPHPADTIAFSVKSLQASAMTLFSSSSRWPWSSSTRWWTAPLPSTSPSLTFASVTCSPRELPSAGRAPSRLSSRCLPEKQRRARHTTRWSKARLNFYRHFCRSEISFKKQWAQFLSQRALEETKKVWN